jgi:hypothetical protein
MLFIGLFCDGTKSAKGSGIMSFPTGNAMPVEYPQPSEEEIASLARKFYEDSNCEEGHDQESWECAAYMLAQKLQIESQLKFLHWRASNAAC